MKGPSAAVLLLTCLSGNAFAAPTGVATSVEARNDAVSFETTMQERNAPPAKFMNEVEAREEVGEQEVKALKKMLDGNPNLLAVLEKLPVVGAIVRQVLTGAILKRADITVDVSDDQIKALQKIVTDVPLVGGLLNGIPVVGPLLNGLLGSLLGGGKSSAGGALDLSKTLNGLTGSLSGVTGSLLPGVVGKREEATEQDEATVPLVGGLVDKVPVVGPLVDGLTDNLLGGLLGILGGAKGNTGDAVSGLTNTAEGALGGVTNGAAGGALSGLTNTAKGALGGVANVVDDTTSGLTGGILRRAEVTVSEEDVEVLRKYAQEIPILSKLPVLGPLLQALGL